MEVKKLDFGETLKDSVAIGVKNAPSVIAAVVLFLITIWIPYINIGTFIAITLLPTQLAKGEVINPLGIFDSKYRRYMGEFLITMGLMVIPIYIAMISIKPSVSSWRAISTNAADLHDRSGHRALDRMVAGLLLPDRKRQEPDAGHQGFERRYLRQQMDDVLRHPRIRSTRLDCHAGFQRYLRPDQRRLHHVRRHVRADSPVYVDRHVDQRFVLEADERQRRVNFTP